MHSQLIDHISDSALILSDCQHICYVNNAALDLFQCDKSELIGQSFVKYYNKWNALQENSTDYPIEVKNILLHLPQKSIKCNLVLSTARDITGYQTTVLIKPTEDSIYSLDTRSLLDSLSEVMYFKDTQGKIILPNKDLAAQLGYSSAEDLIGKTDQELFGEDFGAKTRKNEEEIVLSGKAKIEWPSKRINEKGQSIHSNITKLPLKNKKGEVVGIAGTYRMTTDIIKDRRALEEQKHQLITTNLVAKIAYWEYDLIRRKYILNDLAYNIVGFTAEEMGGYELDFEFFAKKTKLSKDTIALINIEMSKAFSTSDPDYRATYVHPFIDAHDEEQYLEVQLSVEMNDKGKVIKIYGTNQIVTEQVLRNQKIFEDKLLFDEVFNNVDVAPVKYNLKTHRAVYSSYAERLIGSPADQLPHTPEEILNAIHPADQERAIADYDRLFTEGVYDATLRVRFTPESEEKWVRLKLITPKSEIKNVEEVIGTIQDVTASKRTEEQLRKNENQITTACEIARLGHWEFDLQKEVFSFNDLLYNVLKTDASIQGGYLMSRAQYAERFLPADTAQLVKEEIAKVLVQIDQEYINDLEHRMAFGDGSEGYVRVLIKGKKNENGDIQSVFGIIQDITEQKQLEYSLQENERVISSANEIAKIGHWTYDLDRDEFTFNAPLYSVLRTDASTQGGYTMSSKEYAKRFLPIEAQSSVSEGIQKFFSINDPNYIYRSDHKIIFGDGSIGHVKVLVKARYNELGNIIGSLGILQDITEQKMLEHELIENQRVITVSNEIAKLGSWIYDAKTQSYTFNDLYYKMMKTSVDEMGGYQISREDFKQRFIPTTERHKIGAGTHLLNNSSIDSVYEDDHQVIFGDGSTGYIKTTIKGNFDTKGNLIGVLGISQDVTEQKRLENKLVENDRVMTSVNESAKIGHWVLGFQSRTYEFNDTAYNVLRTNVKREGGYLMDQAVFADKFIPVEDHSKLWEATKRLIKAADPTYFFELDHRIYFGDGSEGYAKVTVKGNFDDQGNLKGVLGITRDITVQKTLENNLKEKDGIITAGNQIAKLGTWTLTMSDLKLHLNDEIYDVLKTTAKDAGEYIIDRQDFLDRYVPKSSQTNIDQLLQKIQSDQNPDGKYSLDHELIFGDGTTGYGKVSVKPNYDENGNLVSLFGVMQDITERKEMELQLIQNEATIKKVHQIAQIGTFKYSVPEDRFDFSPEALAVYDLPGSAPVQAADCTEYIHPEDVQRVYDSFRSLPALSPSLDLDYRSLTKSGSYKWLRLHAGILYDESGSPIEINGLIQDIDQQVSAEKRLTRAYEIAKMSHWHLSVADGIYTFNDQFYKMIRTTAKKEGGYTMNIDQYLNRFVPAHLHESLLATYQDIIKTQDISSFQNQTFPFIYGDGEIGYLTTYISPILDKNGMIAEAIVVSQDVTETKRLENELLSYQTDLQDMVDQRTQELEQSNKDLEAFAYSISHDLRSPLRHINGYATILHHKADEIAKETLNAYLSKISESANQMGSMIDALLAYSTYSRQDLNITEINLNDKISKIIERSEEKLSNRSVLWDIQPLPTISGDKDLIYMVLSNIIGNAIKYTEQKEIAKISVNISDITDATVTIAISDNGIGFDMQYADELFGVFRRLHNSKTYEGSGIGLAHAQQIVRKHGGEIWAEGKINEGSTFYIQLLKA